MAGRLMFHVEHEAIADLDHFGQMVAERNEVMNLVGPATVPHFWSRHVLDSAQLLDHRPDARTWADLGAGAGLPGVVLAILLKHSEGPAPHIYLIDSLAKRCRFLQETVDALELPASVINARAESLDLRCAVVTARACAPLDKLLGFAEPFMHNGADAWFLKGESVENEVAQAGKNWRFDIELFPSLSDTRGRVVHVRRLRRAK
ncbi:MAG: 16S rRNA (guanine(527)-N(7))-methyltransferase RsmG [Asticcacaulis sp.]